MDEVNGKNLEDLTFADIDMMKNATALKWSKKLDFSNEQKRNIFEIKIELKLRLEEARIKDGRRYWTERKEVGLVSFKTNRILINCVSFNKKADYCLLQTNNKFKRFKNIFKNKNAYTIRFHALDLV